MAEYYILDDEKKKRQQMLKQLEVPNVVGGITPAKTAGTTASAVLPKVSTVQEKPQAITRESAMQDIKKQQAGDVTSQLRQVQGTNRAAQKKAILDSGGVPSDEKQQTVTLGDRVGAVGDSAFAGLTAINRGLTSSLKAVTDLTAPLYRKIEDSDLYQNAGAIGKGLIGHFSGLNLYQGAKKISDYYYGADDAAQQKVQENIQQGKIGEIGNALTQGTVQAVPSAIAAFMSGGSSVGAQAAAQTGQAGAQLMGQELQRIASSPQFILSATQSFGGAYDEAMESGASPTQAITAAVMTALPESLIETMGGTEKLVQKLAGESGRTGVAGKLKDILQSMAEEGLEEIVQYPVSGTVAKGSYAPKTKVFSTTEKAIINPVEMGQAGAMGAAIGGIMGGGANVVNAGIDAGSRIASRAAGDIRAGAENAQIAGEMARRRLAGGIETGDIKADVRAESRIDADANTQIDTQTNTQTNAGADTAAQGSTVPDRVVNHILEQERVQPQAEAQGEQQRSVRGQQYETRARNTFRQQIGEALGVPRNAETRAALNPLIDEAAGEIWQTGRVSEETATRLFDEAYQRGVVVMDEYYNQYRGLRDEIRTTPLMISPEDRSNIQDYNNWRRQNMGIVTVSQRGTPVDIKYQELSGRYPDLFPADITHPADQLQQIAEVARGITRTEMDLDSYYGDDAADYRRFARYGFDRALEEFADQVRYVRDYEASRTRAPQMQETATIEQITAAWDQVDQARRNAERVRNRYLLTENDRVQAERLARGEITADQLPPGVATNAIIEVAAAERAILDAEEPIRRYNAARHAQLDSWMDEFLTTADLWTDKRTGFQYSRETMERNIRDITGNSREGQRIIDAIFTPIHQNEAGRQRMINQYKDQIRALNLSREESSYVQMVGEGVMDLEELSQGIDRQKIQDAVALMRDRIYPELLQRVNEALVRNGYRPIHGRNNYFPHFESPDDPLVQAFARLGMTIQTDELPTDINGLTHIFRPGRQWSGNLQERTGERTEYDALEGFDRYIESISSVIWHTDDIQNLRALESAIRRRYSEAGQRERIDAVRADTTLTEEDRQQRLEELFGEDLSHLGGFASELRSYTDSLAGKKSLGDRNVERMVSRKIYSISKALEGRVAANMVALNPGSWLTNFIPIAQATAQVKPKYLISAMNDTIRAAANDDGFRSRSAFLTNRRGSDALRQTAIEQVTNVLTQPMNIIDSFTASVVTRGLYKQNVDAGMAPSAAMADADARAAEIMADRSKGALPTIFEQKNPLAKLFTMYQVEVNNQMSWMFKDIPREEGQNGKKRLAAALMSLGVSSWLYNELYEYFVGRRPAFDVIGMAADAVDAYKNEDVGTATLETLKSVGGQLPFIGGLMEGGRIPISSAIPDVAKIAQGVNGLTSGEMAPNAAWGKIGKELAKPAAYLLPPVGGGQLKKSIEGLSTVLQGGSYTTKSDGSREMQYPVEQTVGNAITGLLFGKSSLPGANQYYQNFEKTTEMSGRGNLLDAFNLSGKTTSRDTVAENATAMDTPRIVEWSTTDEDGLKTPHSVTLTGKQQKQYREIYQSLLPEGFGQMEENQQLKARQYAKQMAQAQILESIGQEGYTPDGWVLEAKEAEDAGIGIKQYIGLKEILSGIESDKDEDGKTITGSSTQKKREALMERDDLTNEQKSLLDQLLIQSGDSRKQVDYSSPEALQYSTLSKDEKARVDAARAAFPSMSVDDVDKYQEVCKSGTASDKREKLQELGMSLVDSVVFEQLSGTSAAKIDTTDKEAALKSTMSGSEKNQFAAAQLAFPGMPAAEYLTFKAAMDGSDDVAALKELGMSTRQAQKFIRLTKLGESDKVESWEDVLLATMTDSQQEKLQTVRQYVPEMSVEAFDRIYTVVNSAQGLKNAKGKTISGSKKQAAIAALMALGLSYEGAEIMYNVCG